MEIRSHKAIYCLIEVVAKAGLTVSIVQYSLLIIPPLLQCRIYHWPHKKDGLSRGGQFIIIVFYYFSAPEICPDKQGNNLAMFYYMFVHLTSGLI